jgi:hypothetical protein
VENANLMDMNNLVYAINADYYKNKFFLPCYVGDSKIYKLHCQNIQKRIGSGEPITQPIPPKKTKVDIQMEIHTLSDLIALVETYEYKETEEYNIDLKSLTHIQEELRQIQGMVGMETLKTNILHQLLYFLQNLHIQDGGQLAPEGCDGSKKILGSKGSSDLREQLAPEGCDGSKKILGSLGSHDFKHTVIYGPPGTGKTEIAKLIGKMYAKIGILDKNVFKKVTRGDLVAGYLGQTAIKTKNAIQEALGGVLFIDEAYSLANGKNDLDSFSKECIDTLCEALSDHKENLMVIIAGYEEELNDCFFQANKGLESRFIWRFKIENYTAKELYQIFMKKVQEIHWSIDPLSPISLEWFVKNKSHFVYFGRDMELLLSYTKIMHSKRIFGKPRECQRVIAQEDLEAGLSLFIHNKKEKKISHLHSLYV